MLLIFLPYVCCIVIFACRVPVCVSTQFKYVTHTYPALAGPSGVSKSMADSRPKGTSTSTEPPSGGRVSTLTPLFLLFPV